MPLTLADFDYDLPQELIAQFPLPERTASRLLVVDGAKLEDRRFSDITQLLRAGDLLVFNDTRVLHARLHGIKDSGGRVEVLIERPIGRHEALAQIRASHAPWPGSRLVLEGTLEIRVVAREGAFYLLRFPGPEDLVELLERHGKLPLPPYIQRHAEEADEARYQTVYARNRGSVAAPTAGLHFDAALMEALRARGIDFAWLTLHVGAGTFQPVRVENLAQHRMHRERYVIPADTVAALAGARARGGRIVAVGTTSLRLLESAADRDGTIRPFAAETSIFITPGYRFRTVDVLMTNFHLPRSTLFMLVSAFAGMETMKAAYARAIATGYRFYSYGDGSLLFRGAMR